MTDKKHRKKGTGRIRIVYAVFLVLYIMTRRTAPEEAVANGQALKAVIQIDGEKVHTMDLDKDAEYRAEMERKIAELSEEINNGEPLDIPVDPKPPEDAAEQIVEDIGPVGIPVTLIPDGDNPYIFDGYDGSHANGLPYVPFDGYMAMLHKGERVMTARENANYGRNYNSNLYVESMYMNNGMDAAGLAAAMAAAQRRTMSGYGS